MIEVGRNAAERLITIRASGSLTKDDYAQAVPEIEQAIAEAGGDLSAIVILESLDSVDIAALWADLQFDVKHHDNFRRIAVVGSSKTVESTTEAADMVTGAKLEFFLADQLDDAHSWARTG